MDDVRIKRFLVYTNENPNTFSVFVSDLDTALVELQGMVEGRIKDYTVEGPAKYLLPMRRAKFIQDAIQEKLDRESKG